MRLESTCKPHKEHYEWDWNLPANRVKAWDFLLRSYCSSYQHWVHCECLACFLKKNGVKFRQWSAITRKLSYPLWSDGNHTLSFHFSGLWLAPKTFYCYLNKLNLTYIYMKMTCSLVWSSETFFWVCYKAWVAKQFPFNLTYVT